ncbi:hypothetical protein [Pseudomonas oryzihabitans]|uniref:Uncharacterized protein n=1 Tax=Pseudomonas oryzihabitans TaxID=47885 RepID=A0A1G5MVN8_9PSED|nr:hypothetical protein [Pseudomonas psychrotolerans]NMY89790.1 hypothetical protein [Pseudomonas psychrotolerans]SCZ28639.1 hypothetical protein SAMN05216279_10387 [Pseudomonas psychrotolerans]
MSKPYVAWLREEIESATPYTRQRDILPHVEHLAQVCRREISSAETVPTQHLYHRMLRDFEDLLKQYAVAA